MDKSMGMMKVHVKRGLNLAVRDVRTSDPYVVITMGKQRLKTKVVNANINPVWNETLSLSLIDPNTPVKLTVYDYDVLSMDDEMGNAEFDVRTFLECLAMDHSDFPDGTVLAKVQPSRQNCLAEESTVVLKNGKVVQDLCLRLRNVECGEVELQLGWVNLRLP